MDLAADPVGEVSVENNITLVTTTYGDDDDDVDHPDRVVEVSGENNISLVTMLAMMMVMTLHQ